MATQTSETRLNSSDGSSARLYRPRRFNRQSKQRFEKNRIDELVRHLGREPSYPEKILISRVVAIEWDLRRLDSKLDAGNELSGHDIRGRLAAETRLRLDLQALGMRPAAARAPSLSELMREATEARQRGEAA